jgi:hypothetical protein
MEGPRGAGACPSSSVKCGAIWCVAGYHKLTVDTTPLPDAVEPRDRETGD